MKRKLCFALCAMTLALGGCATGVNAIDAAVPQAALQPQEQSAAPLPAPVEPGATEAPVTDPAVAAPAAAEPRDTGTFPNLNDEPARSTNQMTDAERDALLAEMLLLQQQQAAGTVSAAAYQNRMAELQRLAATHSAETLQQIEGQ